jgi:hypothetical protein
VSLHPELLWKQLNQAEAKQILIQEQMTFLSVIGGAYSAIGKTSRQHALKAAELAKTQIVLARKLKDEETELRFWIYLAECYARAAQQKQARMILDGVQKMLQRYPKLTSAYLSFNA